MIVSEQQLWALIESLREELLAGDHLDRADQEAAHRTGGVPVYSDMSGCLLIQPDGQIVRFDYETEAIAPELRPQWLKIAKHSAARRFPALTALLPPKPPHARLCEQCDGSGEISGAWCGRCFGVGWLEPVK